jgi:hypothetical protein
VPNRLSQIALTVLVLGGLGRTFASGQEPKEPAAAEPKAAERPPLPSPDPIPPARLLPTLHTIPFHRGTREFNTTMIDTKPTSSEIRHRPGLWVLDFAFKPVRLITYEGPDKRRHILHYLYYRVVNRTGVARAFVPQFTLITDTGKRYEEAVLPQAVELIRTREDRSIPLVGAVTCNGIIPPSKKKDIDDAVFGVAIWEGVDPDADAFKIYVRGLSDGMQVVYPPEGAQPVVRYKTLRIDFIRRGDKHSLHEREIELLDPPYEWIYW